MGLKSEFMAIGAPASLANRLGYDPVTAFTAAGSTQGTATILTANNATVTTASSGQGVILGSAEQKYAIFNSGPFVLQIYPPVGDNFTGLAVNAGLCLCANACALIDPGGAGAIGWTVNN